jgi:hypothetical protein
MTFNTDQAIEDVIENFNGDVRGAIQALLVVNERLETELTYCHELMTTRLGIPGALH